MRTLSPAMLVELGLTVTRPGYLVCLEFSTPIFLSTMGDITWDGHTWVGADVDIKGIGQDGSANNSGQLVLGNTDNAFGALVLLEGASGIVATVFAAYVGATAAGDPVLLFSGVANGADIDVSKVTIALAAQANRTVYSPRVFINAAAGFNHLQPAGTKIIVGTETFVLERG